jgi:TPP-dependent 2-oxoacid decarboxylase
MQPTVGSFLFDYLYRKGVHHAFGIPGDFALPTFRWLEQSDITLYTMTHEPSVGFAADAYARIHGLGLAAVTYCVGGLNMLNSVACAYAEKSPMIVISGGPSASDRKHDPLLHHKVRTFDTQRRIFEEVTCANTVLLDPEHAAEEIMRVVETVQAQCRPGYIEIPYDVVDQPIPIPVYRNKPAPESDRENLEACLSEALSMIHAAKQPVIVADVELHRHGLTDIAVAIADKFNIPIAATLLSKSIISETHPRYIGVYSGGLSEPVVQQYVEDSDCLILLGAFITDVFLGLNTAKLERKRTIVVNTEKTRIGLHAYEDVLFTDFLQGVLASDAPKRDFKNPNPVVPAVPLTDAERAGALDAESFFRIFGLMLPDNATVVCDTGDALLGSMGLRTKDSNNFLADAYYLSMGFAMPAAIGAIAAAPKSRVYAIIGDGAFQMTGIEISTAAKYGMAPVVIVLNNDGYGTQRHIVDGAFNNIQPWDYTKITELVRAGRSVRVNTKGALEAALKDAATAKDMMLIEVVIPRDDCSKSLRRMGEKLGELRNKTS